MRRGWVSGGVEGSRRWKTLDVMRARLYHSARRGWSDDRVYQRQGISKSTRLDLSKRISCLMASMSLSSPIPSRCSVTCLRHLFTLHAEFTARQHYAFSHHCPLYMYIYMSIACRILYNTPRGIWAHIYHIHADVDALKIFYAKRLFFRRCQRIFFF